MWIHSTRKIAALGDVFEVEASRRQSVPMNENTDIHRLQGNAFSPVNVYQSVLGSLNYICSATRPDICTAVNLLARYGQSPKMGHFRLARKCVRYLCQSLQWQLCFRRPTHLPPFKLVVYTDAYFERRSPDGKSTHGYVIYLNSHLLKYETKKLRRVTRSTCDAETLGLLEAVRATKGLLLILEECGVPVPDVQFYHDLTS